jgi:hypothetical protein
MARTTLGRITVPSGVLVIGDMGCLVDWSGDDPPLPPQGFPELADTAAKAKDWRVVGRDADVVAAKLELQSLRYLYDVPDEPRLHELFAAVLDGTDLEARLSQEPERVPHRERARRAAAAGGADFVLHGVPFVAVPVQAEGPLQVAGARSRDDPSRWSSVEVELSDRPVAGTRVVGWVGVDWARLVLADLDALSAWVHEDPLDGQADVAFWGVDAAQAARRFGAAELAGEGQDTFGWADLPVDDAADRYVELEAWKDAGAHKLALDFRPHSHHFEVMRQVRAGETESGSIRVGGAELLAFMTTWGDGAFDVELDDDEGGRAVAVRIVFDR